MQQPRPAVWVGANVGPGIRRAGHLADAWMVGFGDRLPALAPRVAQFRADSHASARSGEVCLMRLVGIGGSRASVEATWLPQVLATLRSYRRAEAPGERNQDASAKLRGGGATTLADLGNDMFIGGTPDDVIVGIKRCQEMTGCEHFIPGLGGDADPMSALELFGREVIPACR